jgi:hypothetical protein
MEAIIFIGIAVAVIYFLLKKNRTEPLTQEASDESEWEKELRQAQERLNAALIACRQDHPEATESLCWLAGSDGTVSKQELRTVMRFCVEQGTNINQAAFKDIDKLNAGLRVDNSTTEAEAHSLIQKIASRPTGYRVAFFGVANKLCGNQKNISIKKQKFIKAASELLNN